MKPNHRNFGRPVILQFLSTFTILVAATLLPLPLPLHAAGPAGGDSRTEALFGLDSVCEATSHAAYLACFNEHRDDFWIGLGICNYIGEAQDRVDCYGENRAAFDEGVDECAAQQDGRNEVCSMLGEVRYEPEYSPEDFVDPAAIGDTVEPNPYFPLVPGYRWVYEGNGEQNVVEVLDETKVIDGVPCVVVHDVVSEMPSADDGEESALQQDEGDGDGEAAGQVTEDTLDWYAQDVDGNVWYFGEISQTFEDGELVDIEGSWKAGRDGAKAGILMPAMPVPGSVYRQEFALGDAEDMAKVVSLEAMPELGDQNIGDCSGGCLQTEEWTPVAPDDPHEYKYYQAGVGTVQETVPDTGETVELVEFSN